ncbi:MAG: hypothetical protein WC342_06515 [Methanoregula sp.]
MKGKKNRSISLLGVSCEGLDPDLIKRHLAYLVIITILAKFLILFVTTSVFHSFVDYFDFQYYIQSAVNIIQGQMPYVDFGFDYPPLALIPILIAFVPAYLTQSGDVFVLAFQCLMVLCDIVIVICIYCIGLKLYNEKTAFIAAFLYTSAFSVAYFVMTKYDSYPTCILMLAVLLTVYRSEFRGYIAVVAGFLAKIFPVISLPFLVLYNAKSTSLKQEIVRFAKIGIPVGVVCLVPILILKPGIILSYFSGSLIRSDVYVNTATYTLYEYLNAILHTGISLAAVSTFMYAIMALFLLFFVAVAWIEPKKDTRLLVKLLAISIFVVIFCMKYHSPQYVVWFTPFVCLLVADSLYGIILFYATQVITYIEFPLAFGTLYLNGNYVGESGTSLWYLALVFFTINFAAYLLLMYVAVKPTGSHARMLFGKIREK